VAALVAAVAAVLVVSVAEALVAEAQEAVGKYCFITRNNFRKAVKFI
jgi:hypothetical protein